jgi:hypothetical protein
MKKEIKKEFDDFMQSGRSMSSLEFDKKSDEFLSSKSKEEKEKLSECFLEYFSTKLQQYQDVTSKISFLNEDIKMTAMNII